MTDIVVTLTIFWPSHNQHDVLHIKSLSAVIFILFPDTIRALDRISKLPVIFERLSIQNCLNWSFFARQKWKLPNTHHMSSVLPKVPDTITFTVWNKNIFWDIKPGGYSNNRLLSFILDFKTHSYIMQIMLKVLTLEVVISRLKNQTNKHFKISVDIRITWLSSFYTNVWIIFCLFVCLFLFC